MGKGGKSSNGAGIAQKHLHSRISYLYQAAVYLNAAEREVKITEVQITEVQITGLKSSKSKREATSSNTVPPASAPIPQMATASDTQLRPLKSSIARHDFSGQTYHLLSSMRSVSQKAQIRLSRSIKRSVCRRCNALLIMNSTAEIENASRGGRKPWADMLVVTCCQCGAVKRYPVGMGEEGKQLKENRE